MKKIIIGLFIIIGVGTGVTLSRVFSKTNTEVHIPVVEFNISSIPTLEVTSIPKTFIIPKINISTGIELVANDEVGNMDVPKDAANVGWYKPGFKPGQKGNAVLAGHFDDPNGDPAVFYNLDKLEEGDTLEVISENNKKYIFTVTHKESYPVQEFPVSTVFGPSERSMLNLITCEGVFDKSAETYTHRLVVFSELEEVVDL